MSNLVDKKAGKDKIYSGHRIWRDSSTAIIFKIIKIWFRRNTHYILCLGSTFFYTNSEWEKPDLREIPVRKKNTLWGFNWFLQLSKKKGKKKIKLGYHLDLSLDPGSTIHTWLSRYFDSLRLGLFIKNGDSSNICLDYFRDFSRVFCEKINNTQVKRVL